MKKILVVAQTEFATLVRSKAFLIGVILMPVIMVGSAYFINATKDTVDATDRRFAYVDRSGIIGPALEAAAAQMNQAVQGERGRTGPRFLPEAVSPDRATPDDLRLQLSERVRREELFAFVEFPAGILDPEGGADIRYYSNHPAYSALPQWLHMTTNQIVQAHRFQQAAIDPRLVQRLTRPADLDQLGLVARDATGQVRDAAEVDPIRTSVVPFAFLMLMYITVMSSAPQLLNSIIEEKMSRISEVLLGSLTPFQLMMGKLVGSTSVSALLAVIYVSGGLAMARYWGYGDAASPGQLAWFALFLVLAVILFGAIFIAVGAACNDLKDSQNMVTPVMLLVMIPVFAASAVLRAPDGMLAVGLSMFPTSAPFLMMLRISMAPGPPFWQVAVTVALMLLTVVGAVWAAGKIFRTGILMQGKSATFGEMLRWVRAG